MLALGPIKAPKLKATRQWQTNPPDSSLSNLEKNRIANTFKEVSLWLKNNKENQSISKNADIPDIKTLEEYFSEMNGQVVELRLPDKRLMGIYPDGEPLKMRYDIEYHASTIVQLSRLKELFNPSRIIVKES